MSLDYLLLPRLSIQAANAQSAWWLINCAPVMAANLFAHNLGLKTQVMPQSVGIVHHDSQLLGESFREFKPQQRRGASFIDKADYPQGSMSLSLQPTATCHLSITLILAYDATDGLPSPGQVDTFLDGARLAGGQIIDHYPIQTAASQTELRNYLTNGYWIIERSDLLADPGTETTDPLDALIAASSQPGLRSDNGINPNSWVIPTTLGYALLTDAAGRPGSREGYPHAYGEPLVGLVQFVPLRALADQPLPLWRPTWLQDDVFIVTTQMER